MTQATKRKVAVLTADIIGSRKYNPRLRKQVDSVLYRSFEDLNRRYVGAVHKKLAFRVTAGDEFQCVLVEVPSAFDVLTYLRASVAISGIEPTITFRASIGVGETSIRGKSNPYEEDGEAFVRAREGLNELDKRRQGWTTITTGNAEADRAINVVLLLTDRLQRNWTIPQWEAIKWSTLGFTRQRISTKVRIAHQNVTKRLAAAGWYEFRQASEFLRETLEQAVKP
jgi:SatD family (SatD)